MRIMTHYTSIMRESFYLYIYTSFPNFNIAVGVEKVHGAVDCPFCTTRHLHIPKLLDALHLGPPLEQADSLLTCHAGLQVVVVCIRWMMSNHNIWFGIDNSLFYELYQLKVWYCVHLNIREQALIPFRHSYRRYGIIHIIIQFFVFGSKSTRLCFCTEYRHICLMSFTGPFPN